MYGAPMNDELLFLKYAYSCGELHRDIAKEITKEELERVRRMVVGVDPIDSAFIREKYPAAVRRLERVSTETRKPAFDTETLDAYFLIYHNAFIDARDGKYAEFPNWAREYCKIHVAKVTEVVESMGNKAFRIAPYELISLNQAGVSAALVPDAHVGDLVVIHQGWAVKKINEQEYVTFKKKYVATQLYTSLRR